jgi:phasin family protein
MQQQATQFLDLYRAGLKTATELMKTSLETAERVQRQQLDAVRGALEENQKSASEIAEVRSLDDLMELQNRLARSQMERMLTFWSSTWRLASENQMALVGQMQSQMNQAQESYGKMSRTGEEVARRAASQVQAAAGGLPEVPSRRQQHEARR